VATQMLKIDNTQCNVSAVTPVSCSIGDEKETRMSLCLVFITQAAHLDQLKRGLRKALYAKVSKANKPVQDDDVQPDMLPDEEAELMEPRFAGKIPSIQWDECYEGYNMALGSGLTATEPRCFEGVKLKNFTIWAQSAGSIKIKVSAQVECDRETKGYLCEMLRHDLQLWLSPPGEPLEFDFSEEDEEVEEID
jgi:hypothetical protein